MRSSNLVDGISLVGSLAGRRLRRIATHAIAAGTNNNAMSQNGEPSAVAGTVAGTDAYIPSFAAIPASGMHTVEISLPPNELSEIMAKMRLWLDRKRFETAGFTCEGIGDGVLIRVDFAATAEAEAFADRFIPPLSSSAPEKAP